MKFPKEQLVDIVKGVWGNTLSIHPTLEGDAPDLSREESMVTCVHISGEWEGAVTIGCSRSLAAELTAIMFELSTCDVADELIRDALGELANMVAGNVKALGPGSDHHLSLPTVVEGEAALLSVPGSQKLGEVHFECLGAPLWVALLEKAKG